MLVPQKYPLMLLLLLLFAMKTVIATPIKDTDLPAVNEEACIRFIIKNNLGSGAPLGQSHRDQLSTFVRETVTGHWVYQLVEKANVDLNGYCCKLLIALLPMIFEHGSRDVKRILLGQLRAHSLVDRLLNRALTECSTFKQAYKTTGLLINALPLSILMESQVLLYQLENEALLGILPKIRDRSKLDALFSPRVELVHQGVSIYFPSELYTRHYRVDGKWDPLLAFSRLWPKSDPLLMPFYYIPKEAAVLLFQESRPVHFFDTYITSAASFEALIQFLMYLATDHATRVMDVLQETETPVFDEVEGKIEGTGLIGYGDKATRKATFQVFTMFCSGLTLLDMRDIQELLRKEPTSANQLAYLLIHLPAALLTDLTIPNPAVFFQHRIQAKGQPFVPGMIPISRLTGLAMSLEFLRRHSGAIIGALKANERNAVMAPRCPHLATRRDLSYQQQRELQWY